MHGTVVRATRRRKGLSVFDQHDSYEQRRNRRIASEHVHHTFAIHTRMIIAHRIHLEWIVILVEFVPVFNANVVVRISIRVFPRITGLRNLHLSNNTRRAKLINDEHLFASNVDSVISITPSVIYFLCRIFFFLSSNGSTDARLLRIGGCGK